MKTKKTVDPVDLFVGCTQLYLCIINIKCIILVQPANMLNAFPVL